MFSMSTLNQILLKDKIYVTNTNLVISSEIIGYVRIHTSIIPTDTYRHQSIKTVSKVIIEALTNIGFNKKNIKISFPMKYAHIIFTNFEFQDKVITLNKSK